MPASTVPITMLIAAACLLGCGCAARMGPTDRPQVSFPVVDRHTPETGRALVPASHTEAASVPADRETRLATLKSPLEGRLSLTEEDVVSEVLARNPTLDQMRATAAVAEARYPQVTSFDDPTFAFWTAPASAGSPNADYAARVEVGQKFLYPGKRALKGNIAKAEAIAAAEDVEDARLQLIEAAKSALADYYFAVKAKGVAEENLKLLGEFRKNAETRYKTGQGQQQDVLQADVEIARQEERLVTLRRVRQVAVARLNTLMHLPPDRPLPPPADGLPSVPIPDAARLRETALGRPDVRAATARVASEEAAIALALKEYNPDVELMAAYDGFWQDAAGRPLQWQVGARVNLPMRYTRRGGALDEARAKVAQRRAELARLTDQVNFQVQEAFELSREAEEVVRLYESKVLPAVEANVKEAQSAYTTNKIPFLNLIEAQRNRASLKDRYFEAVAEAARRRAALERVVGVPLAIPGR